MSSRYTKPYEEYDKRVKSGEIIGRNIPPIEREKYFLTLKMEEAKNRSDYKEVIRLANTIAEICHSQSMESDAYKLEHEAFIYTQKQIYREAGISVSMFRNVPYAERLKEAMTKASEQAVENKMIEYAVYYKKLIVRICRAQRKERDAYILECAIYPMLKTAEEIKKNKTLTDIELQSQCLQWIVEKYGTSLSDEE